MIIPNIHQLLPRILKSIVPLTTIAFLVLPLQSEVISSRKQEATEHQRKSGAVRTNKWRGGIDCARDDPRDVPERNRPGRADRTLVMAALVILRPSKDERLCNIGSSDHKESSEIKDAGKTRRNCHNNDVSNHRNDCTKNAPAVAMVIVVGKISDYYSESKGARIGTN